MAIKVKAVEKMQLVGRYQGQYRYQMAAEIYSSLSEKKVIAEAASAEHGEILEKLGAEVVYPERDIAIRLAHRLETSKILDYVQLSEKVNISKMLVPESLVGKTVLEANLRKQFTASWRGGCQDQPTHGASPG